MKKADVECVWGDGPDIIVRVNAPMDTSKQFDLSLPEAEALVADLLKVILLARDLEAACSQGDEEEL